MDNQSKMVLPAQGVGEEQENNSSQSGVGNGYTRIETAEDTNKIKTGMICSIPGEKFEVLFAVLFLIIASNRKEKKQIEAKKESCQKVGMTTPAIVVPAKIAKEAGYTLVNPISGEEATEAELEGKWVIMEGNTRAHACYAAAKEGKPFDYNFTLVNYPSVIFKGAYRQTNLCNERTKVKDYTNDVLATETTNLILKSYRDKCDEGLSPKGAAFATLGKEITKRDITSIFNGKTPEGLKDTDILKYSDRIYKAVCATFAPNKITSLVKGTLFWKWTASKLSSAKTDKDREKVTAKIEKVFNQMTAVACNSIRDAKGDGGKTRERIIHELLDAEYSKY